jgi:trimethylamine-N-oxide reductase (cytochrome c) cytochrome c-type subunit TorY
MGKQPKDNAKKSGWRFLGSKKGVVLFSLPVLLVVGLSSHEVAVRYFPNITCSACHEMKDPVTRWRDSGVAKNHPNCADCHFDAGIARVWEMNREAVVLFVEHFRRDKEEPIRPPESPIFIDPAREPAYYSLVPNHRCFQCKDAKNHKPMEQAMIHRKLVAFAGTEPCKDCHNHDMRNGMKFHEKILPDQNAPGTEQQPGAPGMVQVPNPAGTAGENLAQN